MVKPRKTGLKAPPRVHAGESVPEVAELEAPDAGVVDDLGAETAVEVPSIEGATEGDAGGMGDRLDPAAVLLAGSAAEVAFVGSSLSEETGVDEGPVPAGEADAAERADGSGERDGGAVPVEIQGSAGPVDIGEREAAVAAADESGERGEAAPEAPADPLEAALAAAAAPRAATPGVVLSEELPIDPDDDLREVEGEASARLVSILESLLFSAAKPLSVKDLRKVLQETSQRQIQLALRHLMEVTRNRGVVLAQVAGGFQFRTHPDNALWVQKMLQAKPTKLSRTQIETLAIVAYRQPVTRPEIDDIRGVDSGAVLKSLLERELIQIVGKKDEPGRPLLYGTTVRFLEFFNLRGLRDLPTLRDFRDLSDESKATLRDRLGDLQFAEAMGQEVLGIAGADEHGEGDRAQEPGSSGPVDSDGAAGQGAAATTEAGAAAGAEEAPQPADAGESEDASRAAAVASPAAADDTPSAGGSGGPRDGDATAGAVEGDEVAGESASPSQPDIDRTDEQTPERAAEAPDGEAPPTHEEEPRGGTEEQT